MIGHVHDTEAEILCAARRFRKGCARGASHYADTEPEIPGHEFDRRREVWPGLGSGI